MALGIIVWKLSPYFHNPVAVIKFAKKLPVKLGVTHNLVYSKAWFSYVGKIPDDRGFYCFPTVPDLAN